MLHALPTFNRAFGWAIAIMAFAFCSVTTTAMRAATPLDPANIPLPTTPDATFTITDFGAVGDGTAINTDAIRNAIDACRAAGGGTVRIPPGDFVTGPLQFVSRMNLHLERGATLKLSTDPKHYRVSRVELYPGKDDDSFENGIQADKCEDISITGHGTIDGQGEYWWTNWISRDPKNPKTHRPHLIVFNDCTRVLVRDVTMINSPMFHFIPRRCRDVRIEGVTIRAPEDSRNTDGIDPSGWNIYIARCTIDCGDDNIVFKPDYPGPNGERAVENALVEDCTVGKGIGIAVGGQTRGGLRNVTIRNCKFTDTRVGIRLKASVGHGGVCEDIVFENLTMTNVHDAIVFTSHYQQPLFTPTTAPVVERSSEFVPVWRDIIVRNVKATGSTRAGRIWGLRESPFENVRFENVQIEANTPLDITYATDVAFESSRVPISAGMTMSPATPQPTSSR
jgi:polygalacturonase